MGRRPDGYHELQSLFVPLELADRVTLEVVDRRARAPGVELELAGDAAGVPAGPDNLVARAAEAFLSAAGRPARIRIALHKVIPPESGLGGGSSDAGTTLRLLHALWPDAVSPERLAALALELGADVPYFLQPEPAWVSGVGERVEPVAGLPALPILVLRPAGGLSTAAVYAAYAASGIALTPPGKAPTVGAFAALLDPEGGATGKGRAGPGGDALLVNDLEAAASALCPAVAELRGILHAAGARAVGLSGSGPAVFGIFATLREAEGAGEHAALRGGQAALWKWAGRTRTAR